MKVNTKTTSRTIPPEESIISPYIKTIFKGIKKSWKTILLSPDIKPHLYSCLGKIDCDLIDKGVTRELVEEKGLDHFIRPRPEDIFRAFKYFDFHELKAIIIGQDPYPDPKKAHGLCFSVPSDVKTPVSLRMIYQCLVKQGFVSKTPSHGNLEGWAKQGVLMLNMYLTRTPNIEHREDSGETWVKSDGGSSKSCMHAFWEPFTNALIKYIANHATKYHGMILWGNEAQKIMQNISKEIATEKVDIYTWGHPSTMNVANQKEGPRNFSNCTNFASINRELEERELRKINWDPDFGAPPSTKIPPKRTNKLKNPKIAEDINKITVFTDGGCLNNGKKNAVASYGVYFPTKFNKKMNGIPKKLICGIVPRHMQELHGTELINDPSGKIIPPTNNRGELLAIIQAFNEIIALGKTTSILVVTDSEYAMKTITTWIWNWHRKDPSFNDRKNTDLINILWEQLEKIKDIVPTKSLFIRDKTDVTWDGLSIVWQGSHCNKEDIPVKGTLEYELYYGNDRADKLCTKALNDHKNKNQ